MDCKPATAFYRDHEDRWNGCLLPEDSDCPSCNRMGIWKSRGEGTVAILVPCFTCARDSKFSWFGEYSTNGVKDHGGLPEVDGSSEMTNKEVFATLIDDQYKELKDERLITPNDASFGCIDRVLLDLAETIRDTEREDLQFIFDGVKVWWASLGSLPIAHEGDTEYELRFFKQQYGLLELEEGELVDQNQESRETSPLSESDEEYECYLCWPLGPNPACPSCGIVITPIAPSPRPSRREESDSTEFSPSTPPAPDMDRGERYSHDHLGDIYRFSMEYYHTLMDDSLNDIERRNTKTLCRKGINILDDVMENEGRMKEEQYRLLMNIFKQIYDL